MRKMRIVTASILCIVLVMGLCGCNNSVANENVENKVENQELVSVDTVDESDSIYFIDGVIVEFCVYNNSIKSMPKMWATIYFPEQGTVKDIWIPESIVDDLYFGWQGRFMVHGNRVRWMGLKYEINTYGTDINPFEVFDIDFNNSWYYEKSADRQGKYKDLMDGVVGYTDANKYAASELLSTMEG